MPPKAQSKHKKSLLSRRKLRRKNVKSTPNKKQGAGYYTVSCQKHGKKGVRDQDFFLRVGIPKGKNHRGCPLCRKET